MINESIVEEILKTRDNIKNGVNVDNGEISRLCTNVSLVKMAVNLFWKRKHGIELVEWEMRVSNLPAFDNSIIKAIYNKEIESDSLPFPDAEDVKPLGEIARFLDNMDFRIQGLNNLNPKTNEGRVLK